jgi:PAS domain S-box-containing protein
VNAGKFALEDTAIIFHPTNLYFAAPREGRQALLDAIDAHLAALKANPQSVYYQSLARWTAQEVAFSLPAWVKIGGWVAGLALLASLAGGVVLKRQVALRTRALTAQNVEMHGINCALRESERKYRELLEHANSIILHWTRDGRITFLNEFGQRFFGYAEAEIVGRNLVGTLVPETGSGGRDMRALMDRISEDPQAFEQNVNENIRRTGETVWIAWTNKVYFDDQGRVDGILSIGTDITARKAADEALRRLNAELEQRVTERTADLAAAMEKAQAADRIKSAFLATMSHELRTPLNSIIGFTGILLQGLAGPLNAEQQKQMRMVQTSSRHLLALINDVLDISKIEAGQLSLSFAAFELRDAIAKVTSLVSPLAARKGIDLRVEIADDVSRVTSDQRRLEQVMLNLLNNAVKFTEKGYVGLACRMEGDGCRLSVSDTGIGIRPEDIPGLFTPFHQVDAGLSRKHEGTGLGLSISQKLMALLGGAIEVHSQWGQGSTFTIRFPRDPGAMPCQRTC